MIQRRFPDAIYASRLHGAGTLPTSRANGHLGEYDGELLMDLLLQHADSPTQLVLEFGSGLGGVTGAAPDMFTRAGLEPAIVGIDFSVGCRAGALRAGAGSYVCADAARTPLIGQCADVIYCLGTMAQLDDSRVSALRRPGSFAQGAT